MGNFKCLVNKYGRFLIALTPSLAPAYSLGPGHRLRGFLLQNPDCFHQSLDPPL